MEEPCLGKPNVCGQIVVVFDEENQQTFGPPFGPNAPPRMKIVPRGLSIPIQRILDPLFPIDITRKLYAAWKNSTVFIDSRNFAKFSVARTRPQNLVTRVCLAKYKTIKNIFSITNSCASLGLILQMDGEKEIRVNKTFLI